MSKKYQIGIMGYGWVATAHIAALNSSTDAEVVAVFDENRPTLLDAAELSAKHGTKIATYNDRKAFFAHPGMNVVNITTYPWQHKDYAVAAAAAGKHIILEKPVALSWKDCQAVEKAVAKAGVQVCVCFECRYSSQFLTTKAMIDSGLLGRIHYGEVDYYHGIGPWYGQYRWNTRKDAGGSALLTAGCHALDALLLCMGDAEVAKVQSYAAYSSSPHFTPYEYPTTSVTIVQFKDGRLGKCTASVDCLQPYYFHTHLVGSEGSLLDNKFHSAKLGGLNKAQWSQLSIKMLDSGDVSDHPYQTQFNAFFAALDKGRAMPLTSLRQALRTHELIFQADAVAARHGAKKP